MRDISERKLAEEALRKAHDELEQRVEERTAELAKTNEQLRQEIAEREQTEETLRRAQRLASIGTLAAGIAHEINNPLGAIALFAATAKRYQEAPDGQRMLQESLSEIEEQVFRCGRIVRSVLEFAREEVSEKWPNDLGEIVWRAHDLIRPLADEKQVTVELHVSGDLPEVSVNPTEIEQVMVNLISNAVQASKQGGRVTVRAQRAADAVHVTVEDKGRGMSEEQASRVFDPFYTQRQYEGRTGLGLSVSYSIVQQHGGTIDVESAPNKGTTMTMILPLDFRPSEGDSRGAGSDR